MTDDEAFVRAVVDGRGDDTPRLVYADWLDDRGDPRGPYLRAEHAWAKAGKGAKPLQALAAALDPVWVARITRPPLGVCCDAVVISPAGPPLTDADLDNLERQCKATLPPQYRAFLLNWNGGFPALNVPPQPPRFPYGISEVNGFMPVIPKGKRWRSREEDLWDVADAADIFRDFHCTADVRPPTDDYLPVAHGGDGDYYLIGFRGRASGRVAFFHDFTHNAGDDEHLGAMAPSLGAFLASMIGNAPQWVRLARNGDAAGLFAWIDAGGNVNVRDPLWNTPLMIAVGQANAAVVRGLVARGAKADRAARELADCIPGADGKRVRAALPKGKK